MLNSLIVALAFALTEITLNGSVIHDSEERVVVYPFEKYDFGNVSDISVLDGDLVVVYEEEWKVPVYVVSIPSEIPEYNETVMIDSLQDSEILKKNVRKVSSVGAIEGFISMLKNSYKNSAYKSHKKMMKNHKKMMKNYHYDDDDYDEDDYNGMGYGHPGCGHHGCGHHGNAVECPSTGCTVIIIASVLGFVIIATCMVYWFNKD